MPFGLTYAPYLDKFVVIFIENILIYSKGRDEHINHLRMVLQTLMEHQLHSEYNKLEFWLEEMVFFGHVVSKKGLRLITEGESSYKVPKAHQCY